MKKLAVVIFTLGLFALSSCHTSSTSPSLVGRWSFTNITGSIVSDYHTTDSTGSYPASTTVTYSFAPATNTLTATTTTFGHGVTTTTIQNTTVNSEIWTFNSDGTDTISETAIHSGSSTPETVSSFGNWAYLSDTHANAVFEIDYPGTTILSNLATEGNNGIEFAISGRTLTLTNINGQYVQGADTLSVNLTLTFTLL